MPAVSIIVPVYNVEKYLDRCIESIVGQTFRDFELILVDDGSPDQCPWMCDNWAIKDSRIKVIHKENGGLSSARNIGIQCATAPYICFVDSDDWITYDAIEYLYTLIDKYKADFVMANHMRVVGKMETRNVDTNICEEVLSNRQFLKLLFKDGTQENVQYAWAKLYKAELFESVRYVEGITLEDVPATFEITLQAKKIVKSSKNVYFYFYNKDSITGVQFNEKRFDLLKIWDIISEKAIEYHCDEWIVQMAKMNRQRADFGLLCNYAMALLPKEKQNQYWPKIRHVAKNFKNNIIVLLRANIPVSRKVLALSFFFSVKGTCQLLRACSKMRRMCKR